jgi:dynein heavy chain
MQLTDEEQFGGLTDSIQTNLSEWTDWATCADPHVEALPLEWNEKLSNFERLLLLKAFRSEKLLFAF